MTPLPEEWALAYILQKWKNKRAVSKAYKAAVNGDENADELRAEALRQLRAFVAALERFEPPANPPSDVR